MESSYLPAEPSGSTDPVDVQLSVVRQIVVDNQGHLKQRVCL